MCEMHVKAMHGYVLLRATEQKFDFNNISLLSKIFHRSYTPRDENIWECINSGLDYWNGGIMEWWARKFLSLFLIFCHV